MSEVAGIPKFYCDNRIGNCPRVFLSTIRPKLMFIPEEIKHGVVFLGLCKGDRDDKKLCGTAFLVSYPIELSTGSHKVFYYLVTARHCIKQIQEKSVDQKVHIRFNTDQGFDFRETSVNDWVVIDEDSSIDVAVCPLELSPEMAIKSVPFAAFAINEVMSSEQLGIGEEVFVVGLFREHFGNKKNLPIVRVGNIAAIPDEDVHSKGYGVVERPYLIECRSIGGLSGSPVYVFSDKWLDPEMQDDEERKYISVSNRRQFRTLYLLGLIHGHWDYMDAVEMASAFGESVNMGIAIVVPCDQIVSVFDTPRLRSVRDEFQRQWSEKHGATPD